MKSAPQCDPSSVLLADPPTFMPLCIYKSSKLRGNLPGGMWQTGHTAGQSG
jgi:hypothetical protein